MKTFVKTGCVALALAATVALPAQASDDHKDRKSSAFEKFDLNGDGGITETELNEVMAAPAEKQNDDGKKKRGMRGLGSFAEMDTNSDGVISEEEFSSKKFSHRGKDKKKEKDAE